MALTSPRSKLPFGVRQPGCRFALLRDSRVARCNPRPRTCPAAFCKIGEILLDLRRTKSEDCRRSGASLNQAPKSPRKASRDVKGAKNGFGSVIDGTTARNQLPN